MPVMREKLLKFLDLKSDLDEVDEIHKAITNGVVFRGTNLWILVFAIIIASVGLNTNSAAVIIGAMLISPLMGPINGMGYAIATYDFNLLRRALRNFAFAVGASLVASTLYFLITPISTAHSELLARTSPTIYDVLIALFGGLAGILAISSRHKGNVIPGVAIATALMPPLCTAGFGLATAQYTYFFGAFYLFTINTVFIGISSVIFSQILKFPIRTLVEPDHKRRVNRLISIVIVVTIIPSLYFGYLLAQKEKFNSKAEKFVSTIGAVDGSYLLRSEIKAETKAIKLVYGGNNLSEASKQSIAKRASDLDLQDAELTFEQGFSFNKVSEDLNEVDNDLRGELNRLTAELQQHARKRDSVESIASTGKHLFSEIQAMYPDVVALTYSEALQYSFKDDSTGTSDSLIVSLIILDVPPGKLKTGDRTKVERWLQVRLPLKRQIQVVYREPE
jgi:uncharacterized hydrophobic protein (TIGR00271 family)